MVRGSYLVVACATLLGGCGAARRCTTPETCGAGAVCEMGRCGPLGTVPVAQTTRRILVDPSRAVAVGSGSAELRFDDHGGPTLLVRFARPWSTSRVERAFLVLEPEPGTPPVPADVRVSIARVIEPWTEGASPSPRIGPVSVRAAFRLDPPRPARVDVTELAREWSRTRDDAPALAIRLETTSGALVLPSPEAGSPVRLDVYVR